MKIINMTVLLIAFALMLTPNASFAEKYVDRPGGSINALTQRLAESLSEASDVRYEIKEKISQSTQRLYEIDNRIKKTSNKAAEMELNAQRNVLAKEENDLRIEATKMVDGSMQKVDDTIFQIERLLRDRGGEEKLTPELKSRINQYFQVTAGLMQDITGGDWDPKAKALLRTLHKKKIVSNKRDDFIAKARTKIKNFAKTIAVYRAQLRYLGDGLEANRKNLHFEGEALSLKVAIDSCENFMGELDITNMERTFLEGLSRDPASYLDDNDSYENQDFLPMTGSTFLKDCLEGNAL